MTVGKQEGTRNWNRKCQMTVHKPVRGCGPLVRQSYDDDDDDSGGGDCDECGQRSINSFGTIEA